MCRRVADLEKYIEGKDISATIGVAHTRWATHGEPNECNAHPHISQSGRIAMVHNGIIENIAVRQTLNSKFAGQQCKKILRENAWSQIKCVFLHSE